MTGTALKLVVPALALLLATAAIAEGAVDTRGNLSGVERTFTTHVVCLKRAP